MYLCEEFAEKKDINYTQNADQYIFIRTWLLFLLFGMYFSAFLCVWISELFTRELGIGAELLLNT